MGYIPDSHISVFIQDSAFNCCLYCFFPEKVAIRRMLNCLFHLFFCAERIAVESFGYVYCKVPFFKGCVEKFGVANSNDFTYTCIPVYLHVHYVYYLAGMNKNMGKALGKCDFDTVYLCGSFGMNLPYVILRE